MVEGADRFLEQLKANEHLFLFSDESIDLLLSRLGAGHIYREPAIFSHYDMFVVAGRAPLRPHSADAIAESLGRTAGGRMIQALLDLADQRDAARRTSADVEPLRGDVAYLKEQIAVSEADRAARLTVIEQQGIELERWCGAAAAGRDRMREAEELLRQARRGWALRLAKALRPDGAARAIERAAEVLQRGETGTDDPAGQQTVAAPRNPTAQPGADRRQASADDLRGKGDSDRTRGGFPN
jgi:hypothetical protein